MLRKREREIVRYVKKNVPKDFQRVREIEMSMREREGDEGGDERKSEKIDRDSKKKTNRWKSMKEMKEYL